MARHQLILPSAKWGRIGLVYCVSAEADMCGRASHGWWLGTRRQLCRTRSVTSHQKSASAGVMVGIFMDNPTTTILIKTEMIMITWQFDHLW